MISLYKIALLHVSTDRFLRICRHYIVFPIGITDHNIIHDELYSIQPAFYKDIKIIPCCITSRQAISTILPDRELLIPILCFVVERPAICFVKCPRRDIADRYLLRGSCI